MQSGLSSNNEIQGRRNNNINNSINSKKNSFFNFKQELADIEQEITCTQQYIVINRGKIHIENYRKIYEISDIKIHILFQKKGDDMIVSGNSLVLKLITDDIIEIIGNISMIEYPNR